MGLFGNALKGLASPQGQEAIYMLGAALKDMSGGGSDNLLMAQQQLEGRRKRAEEDAAFAELSGLFGGGQAPVPAMAGGQGDDTLAGGTGARPTGWSVIDRPAPTPGAGSAGGMSPEMRQRLLNYYGRTKDIGGLLKLWQMDQPTYERGEDGFYEFRQGQSPKLVSRFAEKPREAPSGYRWAADGSGLEAIPGGPGDPKVIDLLAGLRREAIVSRPISARPRAGGGSASSAGSTGLPPGFTPD